MLLSKNKKSNNNKIGFNLIDKLDIDEFQNYIHKIDNFDKDVLYINIYGNA